jgi:hypothetical protein
MESVIEKLNYQVQRIHVIPAGGFKPLATTLKTLGQYLPKKGWSWTVFIFLLVFSFFFNKGDRIK